MRRPTAHPRVGRSLGPWLAVLAVCASSCGLAHAQTSGAPPDLPGSIALEERLRRLEEVNASCSSGSTATATSRIGGIASWRGATSSSSAASASPAGTLDPRPRSRPAEAGEEGGRTSHLGRPGELGRAPASGSSP